MTLNIRINKELKLDIRKCRHILIIGQGDNESCFAEQIKHDIENYKNRKKHAWISVVRWSGGCRRRLHNTTDLLTDRYIILKSVELPNIKMFNEMFIMEKFRYYIHLAEPNIILEEADDLDLVLTKGAAVGMHVIMFANSITECRGYLLDTFPVKLVYKVNGVDESILLTGCAGAEKLKDNEFMLCEIGKQPVIYKNEFV